MHIPKRALPILAGAAAVLAMHCRWDPSGLRAPPRPDGSLTDASLPDASLMDASRADAGAVDAAPVDAAPVDGSPPDAAAVCGNGVVEAGEQCDGNTGGQTCMGRGYTAGTLTCGTDCQYDESGCTTCGDNQCEHASGEDYANCPTDCNWQAIDAGTNHTCGIRRDGSLWCWGRNDRGQLGDSTLVARNVPTRAQLSVQARGVSAGEDFTCAVLVGGTVSCWGKNDHGQLGDNSVVDRHSPTPVPGLTDVRLVAAGGTHACAMTQLGQIYCWGANDKGQLGDASTVERHVPTLVSTSTGLAVAKRITAGEKHTCAIDQADSAWCWGDKGSGRLGDGLNSDQSEPSPVSTSTGMTTVRDLAAAIAHTCAVDTAGVVWCWGNKGNGRLGDDTNSDQPVPAAVVTTTGLTTALRVALGATHTCALRADHVLLCWGRNDQGQLGIGVAGDQTVPELVTPASGLVYAAGFTAGGSHTAAWQASGAGWAWGNGDDGQVGDAANLDRDAPVQIVGN